MRRATDGGRATNRALITLTAAGLLLLLVGAVAAVALRASVGAKDDLLSHQARAFIEAERVQALSERQARKTRAFLLTGDERYVRERDAAAAELPRALAAVGNALGGDPDDPALRAVEERLALVLPIDAELLALKREGAPAEEIESQFERRLQPVRDDLDEAVEALVRRQERVLAQGQEASDRITRRAFFALVFTVLCSFAALAGLGLLLVHAWRAIAAHRAQLEAAAAYREQVMGIIGHDLRSPLAAIFATAAQPDRAEDEIGRQRRRERILRSARRIDALAALLIDFTRARGPGGVPVASQPANLHERVADLLGDLQAAHPHRTFEHAQHGDGRGRFDGDRLSQAVGHLLGNALAASPADRPIRVTTTGDRDRLIVTVHNEGAPMTEAQRAALFQPFGEAREGATVKNSAGFGLFFVREIARAHGGDVSVESSPEQEPGQGPAEGTVVRLELPKTPASRDEQQG